MFSSRGVSQIQVPGTLEENNYIASRLASKIASLVVEILRQVSRLGTGEGGGGRLGKGRCPREGKQSKNYAYDRPEQTRPLARNEEKGESRFLDSLGMKIGTWDRAPRVRCGRFPFQRSTVRWVS